MLNFRGVSDFEASVCTCREVHICRCEFSVHVFFEGRLPLNLALFGLVNIMAPVLIGSQKTNKQTNKQRNKETNKQRSWPLCIPRWLTSVWWGFVRPFWIGRPGNMKRVSFTPCYSCFFGMDFSTIWTILDDFGCQLHQVFGWFWIFELWRNLLSALCQRVIDDDLFILDAQPKMKIYMECQAKTTAFTLKLSLCGNAFPKLQPITQGNMYLRMDGVGIYIYIYLRRMFGKHKGVLGKWWGFLNV